MDRDDATCMRLVAATRDQEAFRELFGRWVPRLLAFYSKHGCTPDVARDLAQEVLLKVWVRAEQYDADRASVAAWLFTIARHQLIDQVRKTRRPEPDPDDPTWVDVAPDLDDSVDVRRNSARVRAALAHLPREQVAVLDRLYFRGASMREIAADVDAPVGTVKTRARLALKALRRHLAKEGAP